MAKNDGGPFFPNERFASLKQLGFKVEYPGITVREWYAGMALNGLLTRMDAGLTHTAELAFQYADAMIAEGEKE